MRRLIPLLVVFVLILSACGVSTYEIKGEVYKKEFVPENSYMYTTYIMSGSTMIPIVDNQIDPEQWLITVGEVEYDVPETLFKQIEVGDYVEGILNGTDTSELTITKQE